MLPSGLPVKVAAFQAPLTPPGALHDLSSLQERVRWCESQGIALLCCPEGLLGGLADYAVNPLAVALEVANGQLAEMLAPIASPSVTTIVGFTERDGHDLYNAAAVFHQGAVLGVYRKRHPAIRQSVYRPGTTLPIFAVQGLTLGILICHDSTFGTDAQSLAARGAQVLVVPTNNGLPLGRPDPYEDARRCDQARARETGLWIVRADVAGTADGLWSRGSSAITAPDGRVVATASAGESGLIVAEIVLAGGALGDRQTWQ